MATRYPHPPRRAFQRTVTSSPNSFPSIELVVGTSSLRMDYSCTDRTYHRQSSDAGCHTSRAESFASGGSREKRRFPQSCADTSSCGQARNTRWNRIAAHRSYHTSCKGRPVSDTKCHAACTIREILVGPQCCCATKNPFQHAFCTSRPPFRSIRYTRICAHQTGPPYPYRILPRLLCGLEDLPVEDLTVLLESYRVCLIMT